MVSEEKKIKIIQFIEIDQAANVKYTNIQSSGPVRVTIIKHVGTGCFIPRIKKTTEALHTIVNLILSSKVISEELQNHVKNDPRISLLDVEVLDEKEAWEICYWIADKYRDSKKLLLSRSSNFFFKHLPAKLSEIIDGALAGDGGIYLTTTRSAIFTLTLSINQLGHLEEFQNELRKYGYSGNINKYRRFDKQKNKYFDICSLSWILHCFQDQQKRWYKNGRKTLPSDVPNTPTFWRWFYAGDGCLYIVSKYSYRILISSNDFSTADVDRMIEMLKNQNIRAVRYWKRDSKYTEFPQWIIAINRRRDVDKFLNFIGPPVKSLEKKWLRPPIEKIICEGCGLLFEPTRGDNKYCTIKCMRRSIDKKHYEKIKRLKNS